MLASSAMRWIVATVLVTAACGVNTDDGTPTLDQRVTVLPNVTGMVVDATSIQVPREGNESLAHLANGSIIVSTVDEGFLRRVDGTTLSPDTITLTTSDADLSEAIVDGDVATSLGGDGKADTYQLPAVTFGTQDRVLVQTNALTAILRNASLTFRPAVELDLSIKGHRVDDFAMVMHGAVQGDIDVEIAANEANAAIEPQVLWKSTPKTFYQQVGLLPVVETVTTSVVLHLETLSKGAGRFHLDAGALAQFEGGVRYTDDNGWDGVADVSFSAYGAAPDASRFAALGVRAWLSVRTDVRLYGIVGPYVEAGPQAKIYKNVNGTAWAADAGLRAAVGGGFKFLNLKLSLPTFDIVNETRPIL
jgi:hypothetical protein